VHQEMSIALLYRETSNDAISSCLQAGVGLVPDGLVLRHGDSCDHTGKCRPEAVPVPVPATLLSAVQPH
jgi:hypothetical protein